MGIFDQVLGALQGNAATGTGTVSTPVALVEMLAQHEGGIAGMLQRFESAGLAQTAQSWIGSGANLPISPEMIHQVMGSTIMQQLAARTGLPMDQLANELSQHLPHVVDGLTPDGQPVAAGGDLMSAGVALLKGRFGIG